MFGSMYITRKARRALTIGLLAASFAAPAAHANNRLVDDWFRDPQVVPMASIGLIDVTAKESSRPIASVATVSIAHDRLVDDWFRNQQLVPMASIGLIDVTAKESSRPIAVPQIITSTQAGNAFAWGDFGIGAGAMLGVVLIVGALALGAGSLRHRSSTLRTS